MNEINLLIIGVVSQPIICAPNRGYSSGCFAEPFTSRCVTDCISLEMKHACYHLKTILDSMVDLFQQNLMSVQRRF